MRLPGGLAQLGWAADEAHFEERPPRAVRVAELWMDRREVQAQRYAACVQDGACTAIPEGACRGDPPTGARACVSWTAARAFCAWAGGRLPTEAEWERAAAGLLPTHRRSTDADAGWSRWYERDGGAARDRTPEGVEDLVSGLAEWTDEIGGLYLPPPRPDAGTPVEGGTGSDPTAETETTFVAADGMDGGLILVDPLPRATSGPWRVVRGGSPRDTEASRTSTRRIVRLADDALPWIGFRCVYAGDDP